MIPPESKVSYFYKGLKKKSPSRHCSLLFDLFFVPSPAEWNEKYGKDGIIRVVGPFGYERIIPTRSQALSHVLQKKPYQYPKPAFASRILSLTAGDGLLTLENNEHKSLRRFLNPAFGTKYLIAQTEQFYYPAINNLVAEFKQQISEEENGEKVVDLYAWGGRCLVSLMC